ncbi:TPA: calcium-binding protein, partial [Staphylococcus aureus]|nr:calcium-binding protein [Staphylococcus aureus]
MSEKKKWYKSTWFTVLTLIFFFPVGLFLMWKYMKWKRWVKILITVLIAIIAIVNITNPPESNKQPQKESTTIEESKP